MRWTVKLELVRDDGVTAIHQLATITRPIVDLRPEEIGLTMEEGRALVQDVERVMIADQVHAYTLCCRACPDCGRLQHYKDTRTKCVQTVHGAYRFRGRRIRSCPCQIKLGYSPAFFPLSELIPRRTTPEVRYLFAELGARIPYREASEVLKVCGYGRMRAGRMTIWRHTVALGGVISDQQREAGCVYKESRHPVRGVSIGIDDTYVRSQLREGSRQLQVTGGRLERNGKLAERFAFVSSAPGWTRDQFTRMLRQHGIGATARIRVITDGDDGLRNFVQRTASADVTQQLDWFHIGMRLERLRKTVQMPMTYREFIHNPGVTEPPERRVFKVRDYLWRGRAWRALLQLRRLRRDARRWGFKRPDQVSDAVRRLDRTIDEFCGYIAGNRRAVPNFAKARAAGKRISTAHVESVMNHVINHRMSKKQQMRWSPGGANCLLQVRTELLNGTLLGRYRSWHQRFRSRSRYTPCAATSAP
jgi:hypothetical protein